jgi:hypothetical protein
VTYELSPVEQLSESLIILMPGPRIYMLVVPYRVRGALAKAGGGVNRRIASKGRQRINKKSIGTAGLGQGRQKQTTEAPSLRATLHKGKIRARAGMRFGTVRTTGNGRPPLTSSPPPPPDADADADADQFPGETLLGN